MTFESEPLHIKRWELNAIVIELLLLGGVATGLAVGLIARLPMLSRIPFYVVSAIGFGFLGILLIPVQGLLVRGQRVRKQSLSSTIGWSVLSVFVYIAIARLMQ
ncbi:MAG: hypothetical protein QOC81_2306 [Thermoanaerobaculia bacterium]|jgi:hypothetical protein|nr:hypothetical protein [Thermoanaerobaculia bacterium]